MFKFIGIFLIFTIGVYYGMHNEKSSISKNINYYGSRAEHIEKRIINNDAIVDYYHKAKEKLP